MENKKAKATKKVRKTKDFFGFEKAINWDVLEKMDAKQLKEVAKILEKVK